MQTDYLHDCFSDQEEGEGRRWGRTCRTDTLTQGAEDQRAGRAVFSCVYLALSSSEETVSFRALIWASLCLTVSTR